MALKNCKECGKEISGQAAACPHCGFKPYKPGGCLIGTLIVFLIIILAVVSEATKTPSTPEQQAKQREARRESSAEIACQYFIKSRLHDPDSAEFGTLADGGAILTKETSDIWVVLLDVRAKNAFNALRLTQFKCRMLRSDGDKFSPIEIEELNLQ